MTGVHSSDQRCIAESRSHRQNLNEMARYPARRSSDRQSFTFLSHYFSSSLHHSARAPIFSIKDFLLG